MKEYVWDETTNRYLENVKMKNLDKTKPRSLLQSKSTQCRLRLLKPKSIQMPFFGEIRRVGEFVIC